MGFLLAAVNTTTTSFEIEAFLWMQLLLFLGVYWEVELLCFYSPPSRIYSSALLPFLEDWILPQGISSVFLWTLTNSDDFLILRAILWLSYCEWFMLMAFFLLFFFELKKHFLLNFSYPKEALYNSPFLLLLFCVPEFVIAGQWPYYLAVSSPLNFYPCGSIILCHIQNFFLIFLSLICPC